MPFRTKKRQNWPKWLNSISSEPLVVEGYLNPQNDRRPHVRHVTSGCPGRTCLKGPEHISFLMGPPTLFHYFSKIVLKWKKVSRIIMMSIYECGGPSLIKTKKCCLIRVQWRGSSFFSRWQNLIYDQKCSRVAWQIWPYYLSKTNWLIKKFVSVNAARERKF